MDRGSKRLIANHHQTRPHQVRQIKHEVEFKVAEKYKSQFRRVDNGSVGLQTRFSFKFHEINIISWKKKLTGKKWQCLCSSACTTSHQDMHRLFVCKHFYFKSTISVIQNLCLKRCDSFEVTASNSKCTTKIGRIGTYECMNRHTNERTNE